MKASTPQIEALKLLRAIFELAEADMRCSADLLERLLGYGAGDVVAYTAHLRRTGLLQAHALGLTLKGLAVATALPEFEPVRATERALQSCAA